MPDIHQTWSSLNTSQAQVLICDLQDAVIANTRTTPRLTIKKSAEVLCEIAQMFALPITFSVVPTGGKAPQVLSALEPFAKPENTFPRNSVSPFFDEQTKLQLASLNRPTIILAGFASEAVVLHAALDAIAQGYGVVLAVDASGGLSEPTHQAALAHMRDAGIILSSVVSISTRLSPDFASPDGARMFGLLQTLRPA